MKTSTSTKITSKNQSRFTTQEIALIGMFAALLAVMAQISLPMPNGMPITIQVFAVTLVGIVLGWRLGLFATLIYILIGAIGIPVFSSFRGGLSVLTGITGGYILAWPVLVVFSGIRHRTASKAANIALTSIFSLIGLGIVEFIGGLQWALLAGDKSVGWVMTYSLTAFIPKDILLMLAAIFFGTHLRRLLSRTLSDHQLF